MIAKPNDANIVTLYNFVAPISATIFFKFLTNLYTVFTSIDKIVETPRELYYVSS